MIFVSPRFCQIICILFFFVEGDLENVPERIILWTVMERLFSGGFVMRYQRLGRESWKGTDVGQHNIFRSRYITANTKVQIYKTALCPVVTFGLETCTLTAKLEEELEVFERKVLRRIYGPTNNKGQWSTTTRSNKFTEPINHRVPESAEIVVDRTCSEN